jgi:hypothetical protein
MLLEIPVLGLHNNSVASVWEGGLAESWDLTGAIIISATNLRILIKDILGNIWGGTKWLASHWTPAWKGLRSYSRGGL